MEVVQGFVDEDCFEGKTQMSRKRAEVKARRALRIKYHELFWQQVKDKSMTDAEVHDNARGAAEDAVRDFLFGKGN